MFFNLPISRTVQCLKPVLWVAIAALGISISATAAPLGVPVGAVDKVQGQTFARNAIGVSYSKAEGDLVGAGEVLSTGRNSAMTVQFEDSTLLTLGANAEVEVDELVYNPTGKSDDNHIVISLSKGTYYYVSGKIKKENVTILTPTATIGIRGTELAIRVEETGSTSVSVVKGAAIMRTRFKKENNKHSDEIFIDVGSTGKISKKGNVSKPFQGIDLTGDENVDRKIPGVAEWLDHEKEEGEDDSKHAFDEEDDERDDQHGKFDDDDPRAYGEREAKHHDDDDDDREVADAGRHGDRDDDDDDDKDKDDDSDDGDDDDGNDGDDGDDDDGDDGDDDDGDHDDDDDDDDEHEARTAERDHDDDDDDHDKS